MEDRLADGRRIAELLASEVSGHGDELAPLAVVDADRSVEPTPAGALAYRVARDDAGVDDGTAGESGDDGVVAAVYVQPERVRIEFRTAQSAVAAAAEAAGLRVRRAGGPPRTLVFVADGAAVKRALDVFAAAVQSD
jgi:hypothetical protein